MFTLSGSEAAQIGEYGLVNNNFVYGKDIEFHFCFHFNFRFFGEDGREENLFLLRKTVECVEVECCCAL